MKKNILLDFFNLANGFSQNNLLWAIFHTMRLRMFLSPPPLFFAASENALFSKNTTDNQIKLPILLMGFQVRQSAPFITVPF
jgi:hypothetical protein